MDPATQDNAAAAEQGAAQPDATSNAPATAEQSAPSKSAAETKLESQLAAAKTKGDGYKKERDVATKERDELRLENGQLKADNERLTNELAAAKAPAPTTEPETSTTAATEPSNEEKIKGLLLRNGLKKAWILADGSTCFDEAHAKHMSGADFDSLTSISVE
jgi:hypothetical protein